MMSPVVMLLEDTAFQQAVRQAKGLALALQQGRLALCHLVIGLERVRVESSSDRFDDASDWLPKLANYHAGELGIDPDATWPVSDEKMPLEPELRDLIGRANSGGLPALLERLRPAAVRPPLEDDPVYTSLLHAAYTVASAHGESQLSLELLMAGACLAQRSGALDVRPSLASSVRVNETAACRLLAKRGWRLPEAIRVDWPHALPPDEQLSKVFEEAATHSEPLVLLVNRAVHASLSLEARERTAYHEAGHAVASLLLRPESVLAEISLSQSAAEGIVKIDPSSNFSGPEWSQEDYLEELEVTLAGRVAERRFSGTLDGNNDGAERDLENATLRAWQCITRLGFDDGIGPVHIAALTEKAGVTQGPLIDLAQTRLQAVLREAESRVAELLERNWPLVEALARLLLERSRLNHDDILLAVPGLGSIEPDSVRPLENQL